MKADESPAHITMSEVDRGIHLTRAALVKIIEDITHVSHPIFGANPPRSAPDEIF